MSSLAIRWAGEELVLYADRALFWPRVQTLFITDPHWGKAATFRHWGIPIPPGGAVAGLARLSGLLTATGAARLIILGDFWHARSSQSPPVLAALHAWRMAHMSVEMLLIRGNHDRHAGPPPANLAIISAEEGLMLAPFVCRHHPVDNIEERVEIAQNAYILSGHLHPVVTLQDRDGSRVRLPCFHFGPRQAILPAFASFSGGGNISQRAGDRIFVIGEQLIREVTIRL